MKKCNSCSIPFYPRNKTIKYCSIECWYKYKRNTRKSLYCGMCNKLFRVVRHDGKKRKYCSIKCSRIAEKHPVYQISNGEILAEYNTVTEAAAAVGGDRRKIGRAIKMGYRHAGFNWCYIK